MERYHLLIVSDDAKDIGILERFSIAAELRREKIDTFIYTYEELVNMVNKGNPLALSALIEGIPIKLSKRIEEQSSKMYKRVGRCWVAQLQNEIRSHYQMHLSVRSSWTL